MKIAVAYKDGHVFQHFGHTEYFKIYNVEDNKVTGTSVINTNGNGHSALAAMLKKIDVDMLICGGIGGGAKKALSEANIKLYGGVSGNADKAVEDFLFGELKFDSEITCNHHGEQHSCGEHHHCSN